MPHRNRRYRPDFRSLLKEAWTPGDAIQFDAIVGACALVAHADGWVTLEELRKLTERFCAIEDLAIFGPEEALEAFDRLIDLFDRDPEIARSDAEALQTCAVTPWPQGAWWLRPVGSLRPMVDLMRPSGTRF